MRSYILIFPLFLLVSCFRSRDYYNSGRYRSDERKRESEKMFKKTQSVRRKCSRGIRLSFK